MEENKKQKRRFGDRRDGKRLKKIDSMHAFMPYLLPKRCDNEAVLKENIPCEKLLEFVAEKNAQSPDFKYTVFHVILAAAAKTIYLRPKMNYFYKGHRLYERNEISFAFTVKRTFEDGSDEALAIFRLRTESEDSPLEQIHKKMAKYINMVRGENKKDGATDIMDTLTKLPRFLVKFIVFVLNRLDYHGWLPASIEKEDPYHCTMYASNLGSIKATADYHHLAEFGTNSLFMLIGEMKDMIDLDENKQVTVKKMLPVSMTVDERIADGFYFAKSFKILKHLLQNPHLLEKSLTDPIDFNV